MGHRALVPILLAISMSMVLAGSRANDLIVGSPSSGDFLLEREIASKSSSFLRIVKLNKTYSGNNYHNITQVRLLDKDKRGKGAEATILCGGPRHNFVSVQFRSKRGHGIDFLVEIYGK